MITTVTKEICIDAAHRVPTHGSKCRNLHGHCYRIQVTCMGELIKKGEQRGMVMDFAFLKQLMVEYIEKPCDHGTILWKEDKLVPSLLCDGIKDRVQYLSDPVLLEGDTITIVGKLYIIPYIPTAENLAKMWWETLYLPVEAGGAHLSGIRVWETPSCFAEYNAQKS